MTQQQDKRALAYCPACGAPVFLAHWTGEGGRRGRWQVCDVEPKRAAVVDKNGEVRHGRASHWPSCTGRRAVRSWIEGGKKVQIQRGNAEAVFSDGDGVGQLVGPDGDGVVFFGWDEASGPVYLSPKPSNDNDNGTPAPAAPPVPSSCEVSP